jgi:hypothetical protein
MKVGYEASDVNDYKLEALGRASESWCNAGLSKSTSIGCFSGISHPSYIGALMVVKNCMLAESKHQYLCAYALASASWSIAFPFARNMDFSFHRAF